MVRMLLVTTAAALVPLLAADPAPPCPFEAWGLGICDDFRKNQRSASGLAAIDGERTFPWPAACPRRALPSSPAELAAIVASGVPTIFTNASGAFGARVAAWRDVEGHFLPRHGGVRLMAVVANSSDLRARGKRLGTEPTLNNAGVAYPHKQRMPLREAHRRMRESRRTGERLWVEQSAMYPHGGLFADMDAAAIAAALFDPYLQLSQANLWFGLTDVAPKESALHHDNGQANLLLQLAGRKKLVLVHPLESHLLYPHSMRSYKSGDPFFRGRRAIEHRWEGWTLNNFSPINVSAPHLGRFPRFAEARPLVCTVHAGEMLVMPPFTWHNVFSYRGPAADAGDGGPNLAVNVWYNEFADRPHGGLPRTDREGVFRQLYERAYNEFLVAAFDKDSKVVPPGGIPPSNYDDRKEADDWETRQEGEDDGEAEFNSMGFDTNDHIGGWCSFLRKRDGWRRPGEEAENAEEAVREGGVAEDEDDEEVRGDDLRGDDD